MGSPDQDLSSWAIDLSPFLVVPPDRPHQPAHARRSNVGKRRLTKALEPRAWCWLETESEEDLLWDPLAIELEEEYETQLSTAESRIAQSHPEASSSAAHPMPAPSRRGSSHLPAAELGSASPAVRQHTVLSLARRDQALKLPRLLLQTRWTDPKVGTGQLLPRPWLVVEIPVTPRRLQRRPSHQGGHDFRVQSDSDDDADEDTDAGDDNYED